MKKSITIFALMVLSIFSISCDPAVEYKPENWQQNGNKFVNKYEGFDLEFPGIGGLIGSKGITPEGDIYNRGKTDNKFKIEKAVLKANGKEYVGEQKFFHDTEIKNIQPNQSQHFRINFGFEEPLSEVLKEPVEMDLIIKVGDKINEISIPMIDSFKN